MISSKSGQQGARAAMQRGYGRSRERERDGHAAFASRNLATPSSTASQIRCASKHSGTREAQLERAAVVLRAATDAIFGKGGRGRQVGHLLALDSPARPPG